MDVRTKLTGLARFSPRLNLLKRFADSENPILSISATYLLRNRTARRIGGYFELAFLVILPAMAITATALTVLYVERDPSIWIPLEDIMLQAFKVIEYIVRIVAYICGFMLLTFPGAMITRSEADGSLLRLLPLDRMEVYRGMIRLNLATFLMPAAIYYLLELALAGFVRIIMSSIHPAFSFMQNGFLMGYAPLSAKIILTGWVIVFLLYTSIYSIHPSFRYQPVWSSFKALILGLFLFSVIICICSAALYGLYDLYSNFHSPVINSIWYYTAAVVFIVSLLFASAIFFARGAIAYRINPTR